MRLNVRHATVYSFDAPMRFVTQSHRLTPASSAAQTVIDWTVAAEGALFGARFTDGAGDLVTTHVGAGAGRADRGRGRGHGRDHRHRRRAARPPRDRSRRGSTCSRRRRSKPNRALRELGAGGARQAATPGRSTGRTGCRHAVAEAIAYEPGATDAATTAAEALELGRGVCQDMAHALIALAHARGLPARYVTGYLLTGEDAGAGEAAHAWAEIYVDDLGWIGFDPANRCCPDERYIRLGSGRDAREAAPIRGVSRGGGIEAMDVVGRRRRQQ